MSLGERMLKILQLSGAVVLAGYALGAAAIILMTLGTGVFLVPRDQCFMALPCIFLAFALRRARGRAIAHLLLIATAYVALVGFSTSCFGGYLPMYEAQGRTLRGLLIAEVASAVAAITTGILGFLASLAATAGGAQE